MTRLLLVLLIAFSGAHLSAVDPTTAEMKSVRNWFRAGFYEEDVDSGHDGYLEVQLEHARLGVHEDTVRGAFARERVDVGL